MSMSYYQLEQLATRQCEHGSNVVCSCTRKSITSEAVKVYLAKAKSKYPNAIVYNCEYSPDYAKHKRYRYVEYPKGGWNTHGLRFVGTAYDICRNHSDVSHRLVNHKGWYVDNDHNETITGEVYQLPGRNGKPRYVPAFSDCCNDGSIIDFHAITDDLSDAVRWSDSMAESSAESAREYEAKDIAEQCINELTEELSNSREELRALIRELKETAIAKNSAVCKAIRSHISSTRASMRQAYKRREELRENYWSSVS